MFKNKCLLIALALLFLSLNTLAKTNVDLVKEYAKLPQVSMMSISPDASKLAFRMNKGGHDLVMIRNLSDFSHIAAVRIDEINPNHIYFVNDNTLVLVATQNIRLRGYRGRHDASWAYAYNIKENKVFPLLTQGYGIYDGQVNLGRVVGVSPDRKSVYMPAYYTEGAYSLYRVSLERKKKPRRLVRGTHDTRDYFMNTDGEIIARERMNNHENLHIIEARVDDEWVEIFRQETEIPTKSFNGVTSDQTHLMFSSYKAETGRVAYYKMAIADGAIEGPIFSQENKDVESVLMGLNRTVYGVRYSGFTPSYEFFDKKLNARMRGMAKALPDNYISISDYTPDWSSIMFYIDGQTSSGDYFLYSQGKLNYISSLRPGIPEGAVNPIVEYEFKTRDDYTIPTLLTLPKVAEQKNLPAIMMPHGGPESYDDKSFDYLSQYFASQGYLVIQPQFRGSDGFGSKHRKLGHGQWGQRMQDDLTDALGSLIDNGMVDKDRVCIVGASYGGYAALAGATYTPDLYKCVVSINGVADVERMLKQEKRDYGSDHWVVSYWQKLLENGDVAEGHLEKISPINYVKNVKAPVLLIHGTRDEIVPFSQSVEFFDEMEDADKEVKLVELEKGNHHLSKAENRMKAMQAIHEFVQKHI